MKKFAKQNLECYNAGKKMGWYVAGFQFGVQMSLSCATAVIIWYGA
jgi:hypothetical protein